MASVMDSIERHIHSVSSELSTRQPRPDDADSSPLPEHATKSGTCMENATEEKTKEEAGVASIEATTTVWGKKGKWLVIAG